MPRWQTRTTRLIAAVVAALASSTGSAAPLQPAPDQPANLLVLYSYGHGGKGTAIFDDGFLSVMAAERVSANRIYSEYLDLGRQAGDPAFHPLLRKLILQKHASHRIGLIVTVQQPALRFLLDELPELAPGAAVVTVQAPPPRAEEVGSRRFLCQLSQFDLQGTLERALELFPATRRLVIVAGASEADRHLSVAAVEAAARLAPGVELETTTELALEPLLARVARLPPHSIILFTQFNRDARGQVTLAYEVEAMITQVASAPVFGLYDFNLNNRGIGGSVVSVQDLGRSTARAALDLLDGRMQLAGPVTIATSLATPIFDWEQIVRWGGDPSRLPVGTTFLNRRPGFLEQYGAYVGAAALVLLLQALLISSLLVQRSRRARAEAERVRLSTAIEQAAEVVLITDAKGSIAYVNPAFETVTGYARAEALGRTPRLLKSGAQDEAFYRTLWTTIASGKTWHGRMVNKKKDGTLFTEDATVSPVRDQAGVITSYVAVKRDITRDLIMEAQLLQSQKMEGIGRLAGGVAHDFNNILSVILGCAGFVLQEMPAGDPLREDLLEIEKAGRRAASLTRQLLAFSRKQVLQPAPLDLNHVLSEMEQMLRRIIGEDIEIVQLLDPGLWPVKADPGQVEQVIMNLTVNARDAMPRGGTVTIETGNVELDQDYASRHEGVEPGPHVMVAVSDTGVGMDEPLMARIFEPFFTTKGLGHGTGLGLSTVYGIVRQSGGSISVRSRPGEGATFEIFLPRDLSPAAADDEAPARVTQAVGAGTVLVVEDDRAVRDVVEKILHGAGYTVLTAANGGEALRTCQQHPAEINLVLTDVVMPQMGGADFVQHATRLRPDLEVIYMSGYTDSALGHRGVLDPGTRFIGKPFTPDELLDKVRAALGHEPRPGLEARGPAVA